jgi:hypothetical protein
VNNIIYLRLIGPVARLKSRPGVIIIIRVRIPPGLSKSGLRSSRFCSRSSRFCSRFCSRLRSSLSSRLRSRFRSRFRSRLRSRLSSNIAPVPTRIGGDLYRTWSPELLTFLTTKRGSVIILIGEDIERDVCLGLLLGLSMLAFTLEFPGRGVPRSVKSSPTSLVVASLLTSKILAMTLLPMGATCILVFLLDELLSLTKLSSRSLA